MKFSLLHKVSSVVLALLVLVSTLSLAIEKHFCGDVLVDVAIFSKVEKCGDELHIISETQEDILKKSCCKDEIDIVEGLDEVTLKTFDDLDDIQKQVLLAYTVAYVQLYESLPKSIIPHKDYSPPLLVKDIQVLDETFLI